MTLLYADTSALARAYLADEPDHAALRALLLEGDDSVVTSELARLELASAIRGAARTRRGVPARDLLAVIEADCSEDGPVSLLRLRPEVVLPAAYRLVLRHRLRSLDAIHIAVALEQAPLAAEERLEFVTRDRDQARAARASGLVVR